MVNPAATYPRTPREQQPFAPELWAADILQENSNIAILAGNASGCPSNQKGIVALPDKVKEYHQQPSQSELEKSLEPGPGVKIFLASYELGYPLVNLSSRPTANGQPIFTTMEAQSWLEIDHADSSVSPHGDPANALLEKMLKMTPPTPQAGPRLLLNPAEPDQVHAARIEKIQTHIACGDIYQANLTRRFNVGHALSSIDTFKSLSNINPVSHGAWIRIGDFEIISNTMETLFTYNAPERKLRSYPIKGTRRRIDRVSEDKWLLKNDEKERAEHIMIVDLVRNDLGRVCLPGTVKVPHLMEIHGYNGVWHGISTVEGTLETTIPVGRAFSSLFPGGSITGAPKRRAMEIIQALESEPRGVYTGTLGVVYPDGSISTSILIRSLVHDQQGWHLGVGGGIVADSRASRELEEITEKYKVFTLK
ncbi:MAG: anthranilate synthase component I family protein [Myxococcota bacterium]|nr:anthranilate synthase component I family protein [Myxococcota bacterium]